MSGAVDSLYKAFSNTPYTQTLNSSKSKEFIVNKDLQLDRTFVLACYYIATNKHEQRFVFARDAFEAICDYLGTRPPGITTLEQLLEYVDEQGLSVCYLEV